MRFEKEVSKQKKPVERPDGESHTNNLGTSFLICDVPVHVLSKGEEVIVDFRKVAEIVGLSGHIKKMDGNSLMQS